MFNFSPTSFREELLYILKEADAARGFKVVRQLASKGKQLVPVVHGGKPKLRLPSSPFKGERAADMLRSAKAPADPTDNSVVSRQFRAALRNRRHTESASDREMFHEVRRTQSSNKHMKAMMDKHHGDIKRVNVDPEYLKGKAEIAAPTMEELRRNPPNLKNLKVNPDPPPPRPAPKPKKKYEDSYDGREKERHEAQMEIMNHARLQIADSKKGIQPKHIMMGVVAPIAALGIAGQAVKLRNELRDGKRSKR